MHIYFSGAGGVGIGPLAEIAHQAGYEVSGSDLSKSLMTDQLEAQGISVAIGQDGSQIASAHEQAPIDWFVYTAALPDNHPELAFARDNGIRASKRDELLAEIIKQKDLKLIAISGTHGKTTTTGMLVWAFKKLGIPISYSVGTTLSFGPSGAYDPKSTYFVYECDEYDKNFLHFQPYLPLITSIDHDHIDTYPTEQDYFDAFRQFAEQSVSTIAWKDQHGEIFRDIQSVDLLESDRVLTKSLYMDGEMNRRNAALAWEGLTKLGFTQRAIGMYLEQFPGTDRRFEKLADNLYTDYGHHPAEITATLQMARELSDHVVLVYQPHQNTRQHEVRKEYRDAPVLAEKVYWLPTYLTREQESLEVLTPEQLIDGLSNKESVQPAELNDELWNVIQKHRDDGHLVLCMGAGTIDSWVRQWSSARPCVCFILVSKDGNYVLQQRDHITGILSPGKVALFGGSIENGETGRDGAIRELREETNVTFDIQDLEYVTSKVIQDPAQDYKGYASVYSLKDVDTSSLQIFEGEGFVEIPPEKVADYPGMFEPSRELLLKYSDFTRG